VTDWRIDELAQRAGVAVDTIRYYQREGLLRSGERNGRTRRYGPEHLEQLERIRALQSRRFSLAAIRALLDRDDPGALEGLLTGSEDTTYDHDELVATTGVPADLIRALTTCGLLRDPAEHGRSAYDTDDVNVLRSFADLRKLAVPDSVLVEMARIYAEGLDAIQQRLVAVFTPNAACDWEPGAAERFHAEAIHEMGRFARDIRVIADYTQQRNLQRVVLQKIEQRAAEGEERDAG
jgi:MerR family transcriptional regulator, copper efflux regulator